MRRSIITAAVSLGLVGVCVHADDRGTGSVEPPGEARTGTTGMLRNIDRQDGDVTLESQGRQMELELPPRALGDLQAGDEVTVGIRKVGRADPGTHPGAPAATTRAAVRPEMRGVVRDCAREDGEVTVESKGTKYALKLSPAALRDIREGDEVAITVQKTGAGDSTQYGDAPSER